MDNEMTPSRALKVLWNIASEHPPYEQAECDAHPDCQAVNDEWEASLHIVDHIIRQFKTMEESSLGKDKQETRIITDP